MVVAWGIAPIGVIDKRAFIEYDVAQMFFGGTQYVCNRSLISHSRPCSLKSVNMVIKMGMLISLRIWLKGFFNKNMKIQLDAINNR